jgi:hypothetical protein
MWWEREKPSLKSNFNHPACTFLTKLFWLIFSQFLFNLPTLHCWTIKPVHGYLCPCAHRISCHSWCFEDGVSMNLHYHRKSVWNKINEDSLNIQHPTLKKESQGKLKPVTVIMSNKEYTAPVLWEWLSICRSKKDYSWCILSTIKEFR